MGRVFCVVNHLKSVPNLGNGRLIGGASCNNVLICISIKNPHSSSGVSRPQ